MMALPLVTIIERINAISPHRDSSNRLIEAESSLDSLVKMKDKIPPHFIYVLSAFDIKDIDKKNETASKILELVLYAQGKLKHDKKAYMWLMSGKVPQASYNSVSSMSQFKNRCDEFFKAHENYTKIQNDLILTNEKLAKDPSSKKLNSKSEATESKRDEALMKYNLKLMQFLDSLESLVLGIASEKL